MLIQRSLTKVYPHTDYSTFRNIKEYGANLTVTAPRVFDEPFPKKVTHPDPVVASASESIAREECGLCGDRTCRRVV